MVCNKTKAEASELFEKLVQPSFTRLSPVIALYTTRCYYLRQSRLHISALTVVEV